MARVDVGIDALGVHVPATFVEGADLARARGVSEDKLRLGLGVDRFAVPLPGEDAVVMAAEAASRLFETSGLSPSDVGLLLVGTESGVDGAKPVASFVHGLLGLPDDVLTADVQHACFGATAALAHASLWVANPGAGGRVALVIATDVARYPVGSPAEATQGAGAVALAITRDPRIATLSPTEAGIASGDRYDFWRPNDAFDALVDGGASVQGYLMALDVAAGRYLGGRPPRAWDAHLFHAPYPRLVHKAFRRLLDQRFVRLAEGETFEQALARRIDPALAVARQVGNAYSASIYLQLAALVEAREPLGAPADVTLFSYGSGFAASFSGIYLAAGASTGGSLASRLARRRALPIAEYEAVRRASVSLERGGALEAFASPAPPRFRFEGLRAARRVYSAA